jgi:hypothetical protein
MRKSFNSHSLLTITPNNENVEVNMHGPNRSQSARFLFAVIVVLVCVFLHNDNAQAQGCVNARQCTQMIDPLTVGRMNQHNPTGESWWSPRRWEVSVDYRYLHSHRHFVGTDEQEQRATQMSEVNNIIHLFNLSVNYEITPRFSLAATVPLFFAERYGQSTPQNATHASGIGDISVGGRMWLLRPPVESRQNVSFGVGVKLPTGNKAATDTVNGVTRIVDQSIQPGDGGYGLVLDFQSFKAVKSVTLIASGVYLANPKGTNGVPTGRRPSEAIMSVADQYVYRAGALFPFPKTHNITWGMGIRGEGVPSTDLFGSSLGFRRPGYAISVEPGVNITKGKNRWSLSVPVAVRRNRTRSVPDILDNRHGDAAFADYVILTSFGRHF